MKKLFLCALLASLLQAEFISSTTVLLQNNKPIGKAIIGTKFSKQGENILIEGFRPKGGKIIYDTLGVLSTSVILDKDAEIKVLGTKEDDYENVWEQVLLSAQLEENNISSTDPINAGKELFEQRCGTCHALHAYDEFSKNVWPSTIKSMQDNSALDENEFYQVVKFLQRVAPADE